MAVRVVMSPGWERKVLALADPHVARHAVQLEAGVVGNIAGAGLIRTGALIRSVRRERRGVAHQRVWIGTDHWAPLEYGSKAHPISARRKGGYLRFKIKGRVIYKQSVWHPGTREYAPVRTALAQQAG